MHQEESIIEPIIIISSILTVLGVFVISYLVYFNRRKTRLIEENHFMKEEFRQQLMQSQIEVQEQTFHHISKELHDNVGQLLSSSRMLLGLTERNLHNPPESLITANATLGEAIQELRSLSKTLDKEWLSQFDFDANLLNEIQRMNAGNTINVSYQQQHSLQLASGKQIILFRIVQEALQNAIRHAAPKMIRIISIQNDGYYSICISDDGKGFDGNYKNGLGLKNMQHRTLLLGGTISWEKNEMGGTDVFIRLPVKPADE